MMPAKRQFKFLLLKNYLTRQMLNVVKELMRGAIKWEDLTADVVADKAADMAYDLMGGKFNEDILNRDFDMEQELSSTERKWVNEKS